MTFEEFWKQNNNRYWELAQSGPLSLAIHTAAEEAWNIKDNDLNLNKTMLARQCDLAREAETKLEELRGKVQAIRKSDCGAWLGTSQRAFDKRTEMLRLLDALYETGLVNNP